MKKNYVFIHHHFHNGNLGQRTVLGSAFCMKKNFFYVPVANPVTILHLVEIKVCGCNRSKY